MKRILAALSVLAVVVIAAWAYDVNYRTKHALREVDRLRAAIAMRHETHQVLRVEWAYLNRPDRLRRLVEMHNDRLALVPIGPERFGDVAAVPFPPPPEIDPLEAALAAAAASGAFIPSPGGAEPAALAAAAAERLDGGMAFFPVGSPPRQAVLGILPLPGAGTPAGAVPAVKSAGFTEAQALRVAAIGDAAAAAVRPEVAEMPAEAGPALPAHPPAGSAATPNPVFAAPHPAPEPGVAAAATPMPPRRPEVLR